MKKIHLVGMRENANQKQTCNQTFQQLMALFTDEGRRRLPKRLTTSVFLASVFTYSYKMNKCC